VVCQVAMSSTWLQTVVEPLQGYVPEVEPPEVDHITRKPKVDLFSKLKWSACGLLLYLVASQVPLYGIKNAASGDAYYLMRMIMASNRHTLMELGVSPIITSGMIIQLLVGTKMINLDMQLPEDQKLFNSGSKILGILITIGSALAFVLGGQYGTVEALGTFRCVALVLQLVSAGFMVLMLDDLLTKGWGLGSGLNLFIVTNVCEGVLWACLSPLTVQTGGAPQFEGALINLVHSLWAEPNKLKALYGAFFRPDFPNMSGLLATIMIFVAVTYVQGLANDKVKLVPERQQHGGRGAATAKPYPIKLFYASNMPIILLSALTSSLYFMSQLLFRRYPKNPLVKLLGIWEESSARGSRPVWGLSYLLSPPRSIAAVLAEPFHSVFYIVFMLVTCALFAHAWVEMTGSGPNAIKAMLKKNGLKPFAVSKRGAWADLQTKIRTAAALGGMAVATLFIAADLLGAIGSGTGVLMAVTIIYDMWEKAAKDGGLASFQKKLASELETWKKA